MQKPLYCCPDYIVDSDGFIISKRDHRPMKPSLSPHGYLITSVMVDGKVKGMPIHSAVAKTFLGDKTIDGLVVNHIDGDKTNNKLENLEWVTAQENAQHAVRVLGMNMGDKNGNSKEIFGVDAKTGEVKYHYNSLADCARDICGDCNWECVMKSIWRAVKGICKTYKDCIWTYDLATI